MKKEKTIFISLATLLILVSIAFNFFCYKNQNKLIIMAEEDSYAYKYAGKNLIKKEKISDSEIEKYILNIEEFKYSISGTNVEIVGYDGISEELVIPNIIDNKKVNKINKTLFENQHIKTIVISESVEDIEYEKEETLNIKCYNNHYCNQINNANIKISYVTPNEKYSFYNPKLNFEYDKYDGQIRLTKYTGDENIVFIPSTINGYKVTAIDFDVYNISKLFVPNTVNNISNNFLDKTLSICLMATIILSLIALCTVILMIVIIKSKDLSEKVNSIPQYIVSTAYLIAVIGLMQYLRFNSGRYVFIILFTLVISIIYIILSLTLKFSKKETESYEIKIKSNEEFKNQAILLLNEFNNNELKDIIEKIKYSDPVSIPEVKEIEKNILFLIKKIDDINFKEIKQQLLKNIDKRNELIKINKKR